MNYEILGTIYQREQWVRTTCTEAGGVGVEEGRRRLDAWGLSLRGKK